MEKNEKTYELTGKLSEDCTCIILDHAPMLKRLLHPFLGKNLGLKVGIERNKRSDSQNRYIHSVVVKCVQAWMLETSGESKDHDEVYTWLRVSLLGNKLVIKEVLGEQVAIMEGKRFSKMNTKEFAEAINTIITLMDERGCYIPLPRANNYLNDFIKDE